MNVGATYLRVSASQEGNDREMSEANDDVLAYRELIAEVYELAGRSRRTSDTFARGRGQSAARWHVLSVVSTEPLPVPRVAARLGLTRQSIQRTVDELVVDGLVHLVDNPDNRRSALVRITRAGEKVLDELYSLSTASRSAMLQAAGASGAQLRSAARTLRRLIEHFDELES
jgi:DNA-binding MarR family transcriptional regulator